MSDTNAVRPRRRRLPLPTTFGGVAAVAERRGWWLIGWQWGFALASAVAIVLSFDGAWGQPIARAIASLPDAGGIRDARLEWPADAPRTLYEGSHLSLVVDPDGRRDRGLASDITLALEGDRIAFRSLLGWVAFPYPPGTRWSLARLDMVGWLTAWRGPFLLVLGCGVFAGLLASWGLLALVYAAILWVPARIFRPPPSYALLWRAAGAAQLPGCLLMTIAIALYASHQIGLIALLVALPLHLLCGWVFCAGALFRLQGDEPRGSNPFRSPGEAPLDSLPEPDHPFRPR